jgi:uncharacterized membrane protein
VGGDLLDISSLALALTSRDNNRARVIGALLAVLGVTALDCFCAQQLQSASNGNRAWASNGARSSEVTRSVWINKSPEQAYSFWHNVENLPRFMHHLESVQNIGDRRSRWRAKGPRGTTFEWEALTEEDEPNRRIAWKSVEGSQIDNSGTVLFEPGPHGRGTIVRVKLAYNPPRGGVGANLAKLFGKEAGQMLADDLRAFKQIIETGEIIQSDASIHSHMHPAQPPRERRGKDAILSGSHPPLNV